MFILRWRFCITCHLRNGICTLLDTRTDDSQTTVWSRQPSKAHRLVVIIIESSILSQVFPVDSCDDFGVEVPRIQHLFRKVKADAQQVVYEYTLLV
jgi:hypothetical protein